MTNLINLIPQSPTHCVQELSDVEYEQMRCDEYNSVQGKNFDNSVFFDVYDCPMCKNKMKIAFVDEFGDFSLRECSCTVKRKALVNIIKSGISEDLRLKTFDTYNPVEEWQKNLKAAACDYLKSDSGDWFYIGGQSGCGKTHICTAICNKFLNQAKSIRYILWRDYARQMAVNRFSEDYFKTTDEIMQYDVIYIDDFLKSSKPSIEIDFAFELINAAYVRKKRLIISSELLLSDIYRLDEAVAGRIKELSGKFIIQIPKNPNKNYRLKI